MTKGQAARRGDDLHGGDDGDGHLHDGVPPPTGDHQHLLSADGLPLFPEAAWRGPFADYRAAMAGTSEAPDAFHFSGLWAAAAVRARRRIAFRYAYTHYLNIFPLNIGTTGDTKKTSSMRQALHLLSADGIKVLRGIGSTEALADWMTPPDGAGPVAHLLCLEELATLLRRGAMDGSTVLQFLTETFDAPPSYEIPYRKNPVKVPEPTPTLYAGTTAEWFWKSVREEDIHGGFANRLFPFVGGPKAPIPRPVEPDGRKLEAVRRALEALGQEASCEVTWSTEAVPIWDHFYITWKTKIAPGFDPLTQALTKRVPTYAMKLAATYAAFENTLPLITADQMSAAAMVGAYGAECAQWLVNQRRTASVQGDCEEAVQRVLKHSDLPRWRIHQGVGARRWNAEQLERAIGALCRAGIVVVVRQTAREKEVYGLRGRRREA